MSDNVPAALIWSTHFVTLDSEAPVADLIAALRHGDSHYLVIVRDAALQYVFARAELTTMPVVAALMNATALPQWSIAAAIDLYEKFESASVREADSPQRNRLPASFSKARFVLIDAAGHPVKVSEGAVAQGLGPRTGFHHPDMGESLPLRRARSSSFEIDPTQAETAPSGAIPAEDPAIDEGTNAQRFPSITPDRPARAGEELVITVDLLREALDPATQSAGVRITDLDADWQSLDVNVEVQSAVIEFPNSAGVIRVRRNAASVPCTFAGTVSAQLAPDALVVFATFSHGGRTCGYARRDLAAVPQPQTAPAPAALVVETKAPAPVLTARILELDPHAPGRLVWTLSVAEEARPDKWPDKLFDIIDLGADTKAFAATLYERMASARPGEHLQQLRGAGEALWQRAPPCFHAAYWALRRAIGGAFSIQIITNEPYIPWELMRPVGEEADDTADILALEHPVARWIAELEGSLRSRLATGRVVTIAPVYARASDELVRAQDEARMLVDHYAATRIDGKRQPVQQLLYSGLQQETVAVLHFAGHGEFGIGLAGASSIKLEDGSLSADEVSTQEVKLGVRDGPLVLFNACEAGASGAVLGMVGGWAAAFLGRHFRGFIAPLWRVDDQDAATMVVELFDAMLRQHATLGEALRDIRKRHGGDSASFLAYLYFGDVSARFAVATVP